MVTLVSDCWQRVPHPAFVCLASEEGDADPQGKSPSFPEISFPPLQNEHKDSTSLTERLL